LPINADLSEMTFNSSFSGGLGVRKYEMIVTKQIIRIEIEKDEVIFLYIFVIVLMQNYPILPLSILFGVTTMGIFRRSYSLLAD